MTLFILPSGSSYPYLWKIICSPFTSLWKYIFRITGCPLGKRCLPFWIHWYWSHLQSSFLCSYPSKLYRNSCQDFGLQAGRVDILLTSGFLIKSAASCSESCLNFVIIYDTQKTCLTFPTSKNIKEQYKHSTCDFNLCRCCPQNNSASADYTDSSPIVRPLNAAGHDPK